MSALTSVRLLVRKMNGEERKVARNFLTAFSLRGSKAPNQALKLFDLLCREVASNEVLEDRQIETLVYARKANTAFPRLILRLRDKLYESMLLSVNLERPNIFSDRGRAMHEIRKGISQAQILQGRGAWDLVRSILDDCIAKATKYEHYEELAAALRVRLEMRSVDKGKASLDVENLQYERAIRAMVASKKGLEYYHRLGAEIEFKAGRIDLEVLENHISELQVEYNETGSANVAFFLYYLEVHFYQECRLYKSSSRALLKLAELVENNVAVSSPSRIAGVYINLAWNEIYIRKFAVALKHNAKAKEVLPDKHFNLFRCWETDFYAYYYLAKYDDALLWINNLLKQDSGISAEYRTGKREYQKACTLFMMGRHDEVHHILTSLNPIEEDHEGWNLALRTLFIMNDVELEKTENAVNRIENMRKHLEKLRKINRDNPREVLKYEVLRALINSRFDFIETKNRKLEELAKLQSNDEAFMWRILSPELVIFDQWFYSRVFKQKLILAIPPYVPPDLSRTPYVMAERQKYQ